MDFAFVGCLPNSSFLIFMVLLLVMDTARGEVSETRVVSTSVFSQGVLYYVPDFFPG